MMRAPGTHTSRQVPQRPRGAYRLVRDLSLVPAIEGLLLVIRRRKRRTRHVRRLLHWRILTIAEHAPKDILVPAILKVPVLAIAQRVPVREDELPLLRVRLDRVEVECLQQDRRNPPFEACWASCAPHPPAPARIPDVSVRVADVELLPVPARWKDDFSDLCR